MAYPTPFGRYLLLEKLAVGGMAEVFHAKATAEGGFERACVIKRILPHLAAQPSFVNMFFDEARLAAKLHHPGIAQIFDFGRVGDHYFLAMEYLPGEDVHRLLQRARETKTRIPVEIVLRIIGSAATALDYAHRFTETNGRTLGIVHRDISPSNLMVTYTGTVKVLDFGIARAEERLHKTQTGSIKGKPAYMSPEQTSGAAVDARTDVWSLGVCLHELLVSEPLFSRSSDFATGLAVMNDPIPLPSMRRDDVPATLDAVVLKALERQADRRYSCADAFRKALDVVQTTIGHVSDERLAAFMSEFFGPEQSSQRLRPVVGDLVSRPPTDLLPGTGTSTLPDTATRSPSQKSMRRPSARGRLLRALVPGAAAVVLVALAGWWLQRATGKEPGHPPGAAFVQAPAEVSAPAVTATNVPMTVERNPIEAPVAPPIAREVTKRVRGAGRLTTGTGQQPSKPAAAKRSQMASAAVTPQAFLSIDAPEGSEVWLRDRRIGPTPLRRFEVKPGVVEVTIRNQSLGASKQLRLNLANSDEQMAKVTFEKGRLDVLVLPWADVTVDGHPVGQTPLANLQLWEGTHIVRLKSPLGEKTISAQIRPGAKTVINESLP